MTITEEAPTVGQTVVPMFTMKASVLRDALHVHIAAGRDDTLPTLTGIKVEWEPGSPVRFAATDRYRLAVADVTEPESASGSGEFLLPRKDAIELVKMLPKLRRNRTDPLVQVTIVGEKHITVFLSDYGAATSREFMTLMGDFPKYRSLLPDYDPVPTDRISWNPAYMADVAKLPSSSNLPVHWTFYGNTRPMLGKWVNAGIEWQYLLMPVRNREGV